MMHNTTLAAALLTIIALRLFPDDAELKAKIRAELERAAA